MKPKRTYEGKIPTYRRSILGSVETFEGERIETKVKRILRNKEPIKDGAPLIYTERKDGVQPDYNIRTDRWEIATEAMDKVSKSFIASRQNKGKVIPLDTDNKEADSSDTKSN